MVRVGQVVWCGLGLFFRFGSWWACFTGFGACCWFAVAGVFSFDLVLVSDLVLRVAIGGVL